MLKTDPLELAIREISETHHLLGLLITSSESFDYPKAKLVLTELQKKSRQLTKARADLMSRRCKSEGVIEFPAENLQEQISAPEPKL